jgi:Txe/YoeB family toxin of Txe-Axe toxin-antitoxin module
MIDSLGFIEEGWAHYIYWQTQDKRTLKKINKLEISHCRGHYDDK